MKPCKHKFCPNHQRGIEKDKTAPVIQTISPKDGLTSIITQALIYSDYCYYHSIERFGKLKEGKKEDVHNS